jgi:hypothetical protein
MSLFLQIESMKETGDIITIGGYLLSSEILDLVKDVPEETF